MLDKARAKRGLDPVDTSAGRLFKRSRPAFLSSQSDVCSTSTATGAADSSSNNNGRFQARPAARPPGSSTNAAAVAAAAAAGAASSAARKRARDNAAGKGLAFGVGLMSRSSSGGGRPASGLPTTYAALMDLAKKDPAEFGKVGWRIV